MRPSRTVAIAVLTAALAVGALPGLAGSHEPSRVEPIAAAAFKDVILASAGNEPIAPFAALDAANAASGRLDASTSFSEAAAVDAPAPDARPSFVMPKVPAAWAWKAPRYTMSGYATFYDNGTTAMRLPRGTIVVICGAGGCLERVVNDYGPVKQIRVVDMYRPDFFAICGCGWWAGTTWVTVSIY